jgi:tyrosyl-tRNA synthetase
MKGMRCFYFIYIGDASRIITAGGFYVNQKRTTNLSEILVPGIHILKNNLSLFRVGKKNYYIVQWLA